jgi:hypothetical protein
MKLIASNKINSRRHIFPTLFLSAILCFFGCGLSSACEINIPTVADLEDLLTLVQREAPTNFLISADGHWKRYTTNPLSTPEKIDAYIDREIARLKSEGDINSPEQEANFRKQLREKISRYATYVGVGKYAEYYYADRMRLDKVLFEGTNVSISNIPKESSADVNRNYIVLDTMEMAKSGDIPIIIVSPRSKSALKTITHKVDETPVLRKALIPDIYPRIMLVSLLNKVSKQQSGLSAEFDKNKALQLINGDHPSGFKLSFESIIADKTRIRRFIIVNNSLSGTNRARLEFEITTTTNCEYLSRDLADFRPAAFVDEKREYGSKCSPTKFAYSGHIAGLNGYDYEFDHILIKEITPSETKQLFFDEYPKDYFYEDESSGKRVVANLPVGMSSNIKDPTGAYGQPGWFSRNKTALIRAILLIFFVLPLLIMAFAAFKKRNSK